MRQDWRIIGLFIGGVLVLGTIVGGPLLYSIKLSFYTAASFIDPPQWAGLGNYVKVLSEPLFWGSLLNGVTIAISAIVLQVVLGVTIALVLNRQFVGQTVVRALSIVPYFLPTVVACLITQWIPQGQLRQYDARFAGITHLGNTITCTGEVVELMELDGEACARVALTSSNQFGQNKIVGEAIVALA